MDINQVVVSGAIERDPVVKSAESGMMVGFTLAVVDINRQTGQEFKTYVAVETYGQTAAEAEHFRAGDSVIVSGKLKFTSWTGKDGTKKTTLAVLARQVKGVCVAAERKTGKLAFDVG